MLMGVGVDFGVDFGVGVGVGVGVDDDMTMILIICYDDDIMGTLKRFVVWAR